MIDFPHKIVVPQRPDHVIARPQLTALLNQIAHRQLITISAPAGYGKTSLLTDFANGPTPIPICWYTIDLADQDVWVFLNYLAVAVEHRFTGAMHQTIQLLGSTDPPSFTSILTVFTRDLYAVGQHFAIIIDDWHLVDHVAEIDNVVSQLLLRCPFCHLVLASRSYPSLSNVMLLAARRQMISLDEQQLYFSPEESAAVLSTLTETPVSIDQASNLTKQARGWIAGIMLMFQAPALETPMRSFTTTTGERQVYRFLAEQVLNQQPPEVRTFLLESSLLDELTPEHCDAILQRIDSRRLIEMVLQRHLFVSEIKPGVVRFQPLFREFLQEQFCILDPERYRCVALKVADGYVLQGQSLLAFEHYMAIGERRRAQQVIADIGEQLYASGRIETLERWFAALPQDELAVPLLCLKARIALDRGHSDEAQTLADLAEVQGRDGDDQQKARVTLLQAQIARITGKYQRALELAQSVMNGSLHVSQRGAALRTIAIAHHRMGKTNSAIDEFQQALAIEHECGNLHAVAQIQRDLGICYTAIGQLHLAEEYYSQADTYWASVENIGLRAMSLNSKGSTQHLMGRFQEAYTTLGAALRCAREANTPNYQATILSSLGDLYCDLQLWALAKTAYDDAQRLGGSAHLMQCLELSHIRLLLRQHQYQEAAMRLRQLSEAARAMFSHEVLLLESSIACGTQQYSHAQAAIQSLIAELDSSSANSLMTRARAYLIEARIYAHTAAMDHAPMLAALDGAVGCAKQLGHDAFLITELLHMRDLQRRAMAAKWPQSEAWHLRHQDILHLAQALGQHDERPLLTIRTLGTDRILLSNQEVELGWQKAREVLYYLLAHPDGAMIDTLREAIWPHLKPDRSRDTLRSAIYQLRLALPREMIVLQGRHTYRIDRSVVRIDYDIEQFLQILDQRDPERETLYEALDIYQGPFLPAADSEWCTTLRTYVERRYLEALQLAATAAEQEQDFLEALGLFQRLLAVDNLDEATHTGIMRCLIALGNRGAAINQYQHLRHLLQEELGIDPSQSAESTQLYLQVLNE